MKHLVMIVGAIAIPLLGSHHSADVFREVLRQREITRHTLQDRLVVIDRQLTRLYPDLQKEDCEKELFLANIILLSDKEVIENALNDLIGNGHPLTPVNTPK